MLSRGFSYWLYLIIVCSYLLFSEEIDDLDFHSFPVGEFSTLQERFAHRNVNCSWKKATVLRWNRASSSLVTKGIWFMNCSYKPAFLLLSVKTINVNLTPRACISQNKFFNSFPDGKIVALECKANFSSCTYKMAIMTSLSID